MTSIERRNEKLEFSESLSDSTEVIAEEAVDTTDSRSSLDQHLTSSDWCKLLFQDGYLKVLKNFALSGDLQRSSIRSACWKLFLGIIPEDQSQWVEHIGIARQHYDELKEKYLKDPHSNAETSLDLALNNPLSLEEESPWNQYFQDARLKEFIQQDIVRTHPDQQFFRQAEIQTVMLNILFCYARENPDVSYRQGMHELLAPILFVLHSESREDIHSDDSLRAELKVVMDPAYIEQDAYCLFHELMEGMQQFYLNATLEADFAVAREKLVGQQAMKYDPRISTPFESREILASTSAIARKLDKIHEVLLKRYDEQLYYRLQNLGIPPQTYGIRWIRLLFSREFYLPSVLELWDALFAEGISLALMDYIFIVMLMQFRETLLSGDYSTCMQQLMQYPVIFQVSDLVHNALHLRNPSQYPDSIPVVREWTSLSRDDWTSHPLQIQEESKTTRTGEGKNKAQKFASKTKQDISSALKQMKPPMQIHLPTKLHVSSKTRDTSNNKNSIHSPSSSSKDHALPTQEMVNNPKTRPKSLNEVEKIREELENNEAKCLYCGRKMESLLEQLQSSIDVMALPEDVEDSVFLSIAGLKQIRDLLLHKLPFSGELPDYESLTLSTSTFEDEAQVDTDIEKTNHSLHKDDQREDEEVSSLEVSNEQ